MRNDIRNEKLQILQQHLVKLVMDQCNIIQILTGAEVNTEKFCPEVM